MSLYSWIAALFVILATARAQSEPELRPNAYATPLSAVQCGCGTIQPKLDQRVSDMFKQQIESKMDQQDQRILEMFNQQEKKMESIFNGLLTQLDQLVEQRVSQMLERQQNGTEAILKELKQVIENDPDKILAQQLQYVETQFGRNWIVIMERIDDSGNFARPWKDYRDGFGTVGQHFWLGLEKMHQLTKGSSYELAVEMTSHKNGEQRYARYDSFEIGSEAQEYPLVKLGTHSGSAGDAFKFHKSASFSTYDSGKDIAVSKRYGNGGWWFIYEGTWYAYLTGARDSSHKGMWLWNFKPGGPSTRLSSARMMIRAT